MLEVPGNVALNCRGSRCQIRYLFEIQLRRVSVAKEVAESPQLIQAGGGFGGQKGRSDPLDVKLHSPDQIRVIAGFVDAVLEEPRYFLEQLLGCAVEVVKLVSHAVHPFGTVGKSPQARLDPVSDATDVPEAGSQFRIKDREGILIHTP